MAIRCHRAGFESLGGSSIGDVIGGADKPIGNAPGLAGFIHVDDPDDIVVTMSGFDEIGDTFAGGTAPVWAAHDNSSKRWIQL